VKAIFATDTYRLHREINGIAVVEHQVAITLSADHRAVDGAPGAEFIGAIRCIWKSRGLILV
jgi:pyruvate/2-oxoglutarate dehydrogenase complex dihydrolipoamide acyltransferase (E2) component